jgi:hypothetical protein
MLSASAWGGCGSSWVVYAMPNPPPEVELGQLDPCSSRPRRAGQHRRARRPRTRGVEDLRADVAMQAAQLSAGPRDPAHRLGVALGRSRSPNFWSSCAVAMYSCVCASTPTVTRHQHRPGAVPARAASGEPRDLVEGVDDDPADAGARAPG